MGDRVSDWWDSLYNIYIETPEGPRPVTDEIEACRAFLRNRQVARDDNVRGVDVVTSFLCVRWGREYPPLVYETLAQGFGITRQWRYATRDEAKAGHERIVSELKSRIDIKSII